jgi:2-oxoglutarate ferredoxin oxidoreductase subunit gamma
VKPILKTEFVLKGLKESFPERYHHLIPMNEKAIERGKEIIKKVS